MTHGNTKILWLSYTPKVQIWAQRTLWKFNADKHLNARILTNMWTLWTREGIGIQEALLKHCMLVKTRSTRCLLSKSLLYLLSCRIGHCKLPYFIDTARNWEWVSNKMMEHLEANEEACKLLSIALSIILVLRELNNLVGEADVFLKIYIYIYII